MRAYTPKAIFQAHAGAAKMTTQGYQVAKFVTGDWWIVINPSGIRYRVRPFGKPTCNCPQANEESICKHQVWLQAILNDEAEAMAQGSGPDDLDAAIAQADQDEALAGQGVWTVHYLAGGTSPAFRM